eukprot:255097-Chlamydomonas_euryale.AAC.2
MQQQKSAAESEHAELIGEGTDEACAKRLTLRTGSFMQLTGEIIKEEVRTGAAAPLTVAYFASHGTAQPYPQSCITNNKVTRTGVETSAVLAVSCYFVCQTLSPARCRRFNAARAQYTPVEPGFKSFVCAPPPPKPPHLHMQNYALSFETGLLHMPNLALRFDAGLGTFTC